MFISYYNGHGIKLVRPLSTVDNTRDYARVSHSRQWSNYNIHERMKWPQQTRRQLHYLSQRAMRSESDKVVTSL